MATASTASTIKAIHRDIEFLTISGFGDGFVGFTFDEACDAVFEL
jgi:hypothetical protein